MGASQSELAEFQDPGPAVTNERIIKAIKSHEEANDVIIHKIDDSSANKKGEGFMSTLAFVDIEASVDGVRKIYNWIVKSTPRVANRAVMGLKMRVDERESVFFSDLLPSLRQFLNTSNQKEVLPKFCDVPFTSWTAEDKVLIMQNMKTIGWRDAVNKKKGLDIHHVRAAIKWMASFHAITYAFLQKYPGGIEKAKEDFELFFWKIQTMFPDFEDMMMTWREPGNLHLRSLFASLEVEGTNYVERLDKLIEEHGDLSMAAAKVRDDNTYNLETICHGDPWFNNMMFKYDDSDHLIDITMIDWQMSCYYCPALDVIYFLASSTTGDLRKAYMDHILTYYHTNFISTVERLGVSVKYSYEDFMEDFNKTGLHGLNFAIGVLPQVLSDNEDDVLETEEWLDLMGEDVDKQKAADAMKEMTDKIEGSVGRNKLIGERLRDLLDECINNGAL